ncbi:SSU ribosomal protein S6p [hydrothermal vent metagenome]|uniref:SSU ribosomal protein S6p n=1 Tax=hydrothermal vent metagenome TaxID=652676 RepID=A0A1W1BXY4_9ZZZZ
MRHYENLVIIKPTLTQEELEQELKAVEEVITSNGAEIAATETMGMRKLAYPIQKNQRGFYYVVYYTVEPSAISEIERRFRINENLLRFMTVKYDNKKEITAWTKMVEKAKAAPAEEKKEETATEEAAE